ncbi:MAG: hypothetical protein QXS69_03000 [Candidatus Aenigmatarchaeota archaeon]
MDKKRIPLTLSYPGTFKKGNNCFRPNKTALEAWMIAAGFEVLHISGFINQEGILSLEPVAKLVSEPTIEHPLVGETEGYRHNVKILENSR